MEQYTAFAKAYDEFMDNVPYDDWVDYLHGLLKSNGVEDGIICELGCGTGKVTRRLKSLGYDMIGIDNSPDMLDVARSRETPGDESILYLLQDMRSFELYGTVAAIVSICDSLNYITDKNDLLKVFRLVRNYLDPGGVFIFDMNTLHYYRDILASGSFCENREDSSFIWENTFEHRSNRNYIDLTLYLKEENGLFRRYEEIHEQKAYLPGQITGLLESAGLNVRHIYRAFTRKKAGENDERIYFIAQKDKSDHGVYKEVKG